MRIFHADHRDNLTESQVKVLDAWLDDQMLEAKGRTRAIAMYADGKVYSIEKVVPPNEETRRITYQWTDCTTVKPFPAELLEITWENRRHAEDRR